MNDLISAIQVHPFMTGMKEEHLNTIVSCADETTFETGEVIFKQGEVADRFYLIVEGEVNLESVEGGPGEVPVHMVRAGEALGWSWFFAPFLWQFTARAMSPVRAIGFNGAHLLVACEEDHELGFELMKRISQALISTLQAARRRLLGVDQAQVGAVANAVP